MAVCSFPGMDDFDFALAPVFLSAEGARGLDAAAKNGSAELGYRLMCEAGLALAERALVLVRGGSVLVLVGGGNNGGDGLVCARVLRERGAKCRVVLAVPAEKFRNEARFAYEDFVRSGGELEVLPAEEFLEPRGESLVVDALLGTGASGELRPEFAALVRQVNSWKIPVLAADAPTGFASAAGAAGAVCVRAAETLFFGSARLVAFEPSNAEFFGKVAVAPLPFGEELYRRFDSRIRLATPELAQQLLPRRSEFLDKRGQGAALLVAGSAGMPGAAALSSGAALRSGAGLVTLATAERNVPIVASKWSEPVFLPLSGGALCVADVPKILKAASRSDAVCVGPGLSLSESVSSALRDLLPALTKPLVLDADALNVLAAEKGLLGEVQAEAVLTPHEREWKRLFGELPARLGERVETVRARAQACKKVLLLKASPILLALPSGCVFVVPAANSGLAKGGSGDVLSGIIASLISQGASAATAALLGAVLHQLSGRLARAKFGARTMLPSDVIGELGNAFAELEKAGCAEPRSARV